MKKKKNYLFGAKVLNPLVLVLYGIACFYLYSLSQYGGVKRKAPIILGSVILLVLWFLGCFYKKYKESKIIGENQEKLERTREESGTPKKIGFSKVWFFIACFILLATTFITGIKIYQSAIPYNGKLSWFLQDLKNKRQVKFTHNNIYQYNIEGIFEAIESKVVLPKDLYLSSDFKLKFKKDGTITSFDTYLYGKNEDAETESFLISYDENKTDQIIIYLNGVVNADFNEKNKLQPFLNMMQWIPLENTVSPWSGEEYGIVYAGVRNWGYNTEGIIYMDEEGNTRGEGIATREILGYTVSVYAPGKEDIHIPTRFIHDGIHFFPNDTDVDSDKNNKWEVGYSYNEGEETFFLNKNLGYQLSVVDAALGSRFYALLQTQNGGQNWETINGDPYLNNTGVSSGITFINESLGFIGLSHSGGVRAELYRTNNGGLSYEEVSLPKIEIPLGENQLQEPYDFPEMPYEENGKLLLLVGQGQDGDYKGGVKALYQSEDKGKTWEYVKEEER